jgi:hypothetical protein
LRTNINAIIRQELPPDLEDQLLFLQQFQFSQKRKYFAWQTLSDRYFKRYEGLITQRNALLRDMLLKNASPILDNSDAFTFHATIDFDKQKGDFFSFNRTLHKKKIPNSFEQENLDSFIQETSNPPLRERLYVDINFLKNFDWISQAFNKNPTYEKISSRDQCLISYLSSAIDVDFNYSPFNQDGFLNFLQTNKSQKKLIALLKKIKKTIKIMQIDLTAKGNNDYYFSNIGAILSLIFYKQRYTKKDIGLLAKTAFIDPYFLASRDSFFTNPEFDYILIKAAHEHCNNANERANFIQNFENSEKNFCIYYYFVFRNKSPSLLGKLSRLLHAPILKLPSRYSVFAQYLFFWVASSCFFFSILYPVITAIMALKTHLS